MSGVPSRKRREGAPIGSVVEAESRARRKIWIVFDPPVDEDADSEMKGVVVVY